MRGFQDGAGPATAPVGVLVEDADEGYAEDLLGEEPRRRSRRRLAFIALAAGVVVVLVLIAGGAWFLTNRYAGNLDRDEVFSGLDEARRPAPVESATGDPVTFLVVGSDTRSDVPAGELPDGRSDVMMLVRVTGDREHAQVVSLPRDSWVHIPGFGEAKLNAAYAWGGPSLLIETIEGFTGVRIDHYAAIDFQGFVQMTDALGGVDVEVAETTTNGPYTYEAGTNHLNGDEALYYVRQRYRLPGGDFDRVKRQQQYLRSVFASISQKDVLGDLGQLDDFLLALTGATTVDETLTDGALLDLVYDLRSLRPEGITFLTAPVAGTGREGAQSVVYLEPERAELLWTYLRTDTVQEHAAEFSLDQLPTVPN